MSTVTRKYSNVEYVLTVSQEDARIIHALLGVTSGAVSGRLYDQLHEELEKDVGEDRLAKDVDYVRTMNDTNETVDTDDILEWGK